MAINPNILGFPIIWYHNIKVQFFNINYQDSHTFGVWMVIFDIEDTAVYLKLLT